jgi:hypothetical protein
MKKTIQIVCVVVGLGSVTNVWAEDPYQVEWKAQIGTSGRDYCYSVAVDAHGNAYISGRTTGNLGGPNAGDSDVFLSKFNSDGNEIWTTQIGTSAYDQSSSVAIDASSNAYITGFTFGDLDGPNAGERDAFLSKFDSGGNEIWTTQIGTSLLDHGYSVAVDAPGNAYITGVTRGNLGGFDPGSADAFLGKFDSNGSEIWMTQIGSGAYDHSYSVAIDASGNAYISGTTQYNLGGPSAGKYDAFLSKFDSGGNEIWSTQIGTGEDDHSYSVAVDASGNAYISGKTEGDLDGPNAGIEDPFLSKFDSDGNEIWTTQIGTSQWENSKSITVDTAGNTYITGFTYGDLGGPNLGGRDVFLCKFDSSGNEIWTTQIGTSLLDHGSSVALDASGNAYITGFTEGDLGGPNAGFDDAFLVKLEVPEPATLSLLALGALAMLRRRRK